jgi:hypothetical protein
MGSRLVKITTEIADDLFERAQNLARKEKSKKLPPLVTVCGEGLSDEFKNASWEKIRDEIYRGAARDRR